MSSCKSMQAKSNRTQVLGLMNNVPDFVAVEALVSSDRGKTWTRVRMPTSPPGHPEIVLSGHPTAGAASPPAVGVTSLYFGRV